MSDVESGRAPVNGASIYYEVAGKGPPFVMFHAGVADSRQWNNEFERFSKDYRVLRYDLRGFGKSEPVAGEFSHLKDFQGLVEVLGVQTPLVLMGCSMGGTLAMDFALSHPSDVAALIMVASGPSGLRLDVPDHPLAAEAEAAYEAGDLDLVAELETQIWCDGIGRHPDEVDPAMRALAYEMDRLALSHDAKHLGKRLPDFETPAADRLADLAIPVLIIEGKHDIPFILAASDYMQSRIPNARKVTIDGAAHLPNMDRPEEFQAAVSRFLNKNLT